MRRLPAVAVAALSLLLITTPAYAGGDPTSSGPLISRVNCEAGGGVFYSDKGTKTCTTTKVTTLTSPVTRDISVEGVIYTGYSDITSRYTTVTTQTQQGAGAITTTVLGPVLTGATVTPLVCTAEEGGVTTRVDLSECETLGLFDGK